MQMLLIRHSKSFFPPLRFLENTRNVQINIANEIDNRTMIFEGSLFLTLVTNVYVAMVMNKPINENVDPIHVMALKYGLSSCVCDTSNSRAKFVRWLHLQ